MKRLHSSDPNLPEDARNQLFRIETDEANKETNERLDKLVGEIAGLKAELNSVHSKLWRLEKEVLVPAEATQPEESKLSKLLTTIKDLWR